jgi:hypothetical protein
MGCGGDGAVRPVLATEVVEAPGATGEGVRDADRAVNGVRGGGRFAGSVDVFALGLEPGVDDVLVLGFADGLVAADVDGPDLAVFENAFEVKEGGGFFLDPVVVEVSPDCERWVAFPHDYAGADPNVYEPDPTSWHGFAGLTPVMLHEEAYLVDPLSDAAGGDTFDLATLDPEDPVGAEVQAGGAACVRLRSAAVEGYPADPISNGADIDGVYAAEVL